MSVNLVFLSLTNYGTHLSYQKISKFNEVPGVHIDEFGQRKFVILFVSNDLNVVFDGSEIVALGSKTVHYRKKFTDLPVDSRPFSYRMVQYLSDDIAF